MDLPAVGSNTSSKATSVTFLVDRFQQLDQVNHDVHEKADSSVVNKVVLLRFSLECGIHHCQT